MFRVITGSIAKEGEVGTIMGIPEHMAGNRWRLMKTVVLLAASAAALMTFAGFGCGGSGAATPTTTSGPPGSSASSGSPVSSGGAGAQAAPVTTIDYQESPAVAAVRLGKTLAGAHTGDEARAAVYEALARSGVAVKSAAGDVLASTGDRKLTLWLFQEQADNLALDLVENQGWTLTLLTQAIAEHPEGPGAALAEAPEAVGMVLREWAAEAARNPDDPSSFAPLLLAQMAMERGGASDFTAGTIVSDDIELTYFELEILTAGAFASEDAGATSWRETPVGSFFGAVTGAVSSLFVPDVALADDPCSFIKDSWGKDADNFGRKGLDKIWSVATGKVGDWMTTKGMGDLVGGMKGLAGPMKWVNLLSNMLSLYGGYSIELKWDPSPTHYLGYDGGHGNEKLKLTATVSVRPQADDATLKCLKFAGIDRPTSDSVKNARVQWIPLSGTPKHATLDPLGKDAVAAGTFVQAVDASGKATLTLTMSVEKDAKDKDRGRLKKDFIVIQADVTTYKPEPSKLMAAALFGGTKGGVTEAMKGWINKWFPKRAIARIPVEWHEQNRWRGVLDGKNGTRLVFTSQQGLESIWDVALEGALVGMGAPIPFTGKSQVDLKRADAQFTIVGTGTYDMGGDTAAITASYRINRVSLGGTSDAPTLILSGIQVKVVVAGSGGGGNASGGGAGSASIPLEPYSE